MARTHDLPGPISLQKFSLAAGKQFRQRVEERMFAVRALGEFRTQIDCFVNACRFLLGWDRGLRRLQRAVQSISTPQFPIARTGDPREQPRRCPRDSVCGSD
jgi:hypothetical protein